MSCEPPESAEQIVERLLADLDEARLSRDIDHRIDRAVSGFPYDVVPVRSQAVFLRIAAKYVSHLYGCGLRVPQILTSAQARAEVIALLEQNYPGAYDVRYETALLDATSGDDRGLEFVLAQLADVIKSRERQKYVGWVLAKHLAGRSWATKCAIAEHILDRCSAFLPAQLRRCRPGQLADEIPKLIMNDLTSSNWVERARGATRSLKDI